MVRGVFSEFDCKNITSKLEHLELPFSKIHATDLSVCCSLSHVSKIDPFIWRGLN